MRLIAVVALVAGLSGCTIPSLNSPPAAAHSCSEMPKCCGCDGMEHCGKNPDGTTCCKPDDCRCRQMTKR